MRHVDYLVTKLFANANANPNRSAFTLLELLLVIGVIVAVSAIAAPAVNRSFANQSLTKAADRVRVAMGQARVQAIRSGDVHAVSYAPGRGWLDVVPLNQIAALTSRVGQRLQQQQLGLTSDYEDDLLPGRCVFVAGETVNDARAVDAIQSSANGNQSMQMILFYPDGTSQDAALTVQNEVGQLIDVRLRGLTGTASIIRRNGRNR